MMMIFGVLKRKKSPFAKPTPIRGVHPQQAELHSAYRIATENKDSVALEVLIPPVLPRVKRWTSAPLSGSSPLRFGPLRALQW